MTIRAADLEQRPRVVYEGSTTNVLEIRASHIRVRGLEFGPTLSAVDAVRIFSRGDIAVEDCWFSEVGGIAVVANHSSVRGLAVRRSVMLDSKATGMYFGCHDGMSCVVGNLVIEGNYIRGVTAPDPQTGYGLEVKLNSSGLIRDNVIADTKGPGIDVQDYKMRGLMRAIVVVNNTVYVNAAGGITAPESGLRDVDIINNAAPAPAGHRSVPAPQPGPQLTGNVDCTLVACFSNPDGMDFSPFPGSLLTGPGAVPTRGSMPREDFFGVRRGVPPTVGAIERPSAPISLQPQP